MVECIEQATQNAYACKIIRAVDRYTESAKIEAQILTDIREKRGDQRGIVYMHDHFKERKSDGQHFCLVFEKCGMSLYDFIKLNGYKGFCLKHIQAIARQSLEALAFLHKIRLTHTDLKPENILLKEDSYEEIADKASWPIVS